MDTSSVPIGVRPDTFVNAMVELSTEPGTVQEALAARSVSAAAVQQRVLAEQTAKAAAIRAVGARVEGRLTHVLNAVRVRVHAGDLAKLAAIPGVRRVQVARTMQPTNGASGAYTHVGDTWAGKFTGAGTVIGVIDMGIDYTHADFGGPGTVAAYDQARAVADKAPPTSMFPTAKVIGGWDLVGDKYDASKEDTSVPVPDPNPIPCGAHGTHVAGTAAGAGVTKDGKTFTGPYNASTLPGSFAVAPGAAPEAKLRAYKVFGCEGQVSTDVVVAAIDRAVADGVDVINMSLGSVFGTQHDLEAKAVDNATKAGVLVVAAAGNSGPNAYLVGAPATADTALSVAAMDASRKTYPGADLALPAGGGTIHALNANGAAFTTLSAPVVLAGGKAGTLGCTAADYAAAKGKIVVTVRGDCDRVERASLGQKAGAAAVIMINNGDGLPPFEGPIEGVTIPFIGVDGSGPIAELNRAASLTVSPSEVANSGYAHVADFSSAGPRRLDDGLKPEITAPGVSVISAAAGTGTGSAVMSGTSMASPHVAGIAALVRQAHPTWTPLQVKAALVSTADPGKVKDYAATGGPTRAGTGVVRPLAAVDAVAYASTPDGRDSLSFGLMSVAAKTSATRTYEIANTSATPITYDLTTRRATPSRGASFTVSPTRLTVPAKASRAITLTVTMSSTAAAKLPGAAASRDGALTRVAGTVIATPRGKVAGAYPLRTAFLMVPKAVSGVQVRSTALPGSAASSTGSLRLGNSGIHAGTAQVFAWTQTDPAGDTEDPEVPDLVDVGVRSVPGPEAGLPDTERLLVFAVNANKSASTHATQEIDVKIDTTGDGVDDFITIVADAGILASGHPTGAVEAFTYDIHDPKKPVQVDHRKAGAPANTSIMELPVLASSLGLTKGHARIGFTVSSYSVLGGTDKDTTERATFDAFQPVVAAGGDVTLAGGATKTVPISVDPAQREAQTAKGWLVVSVDDRAGQPTADRVPLP